MALVPVYACADNQCMEIDIELRYVSSDQASLGIEPDAGSAVNNDANESDVFGQTQVRAVTDQWQESETLLIAGTVQLDEGDGD